MYYYSKTTRGFYNKEVNGDAIPKDAVEVQDADYSALMTGQASGKVIQPNQSGYPVLADPPEPSVEEKKNQCKEMARYKLQETDYTQASDVAPLLVNQTEFTEYRVLVRDLFLRPVPNPTWPAKPNAVWRE
jgi:hypothetical protein